MKKIQNYLFFVVYLLLNPQLLLQGLKGIYIPVIVQYEWLKDYNISTVIDVGAYVGNVSQALQYLFPAARIYAFDPIEENCKTIKEKDTRGKIIVENVAVSDKNGQAEFYINNYRPTSSLLPFENQFQTKFPLAEKVEVKVINLDTYFKNIKIGEMALLKIDVQGNELQVLKGAKDLLKRVSIIHIETTMGNYYQNQHLFGDVYDLLVQSGFVYKGSIADGQFSPEFGLKLQENSIFINENFRKKVRISLPGRNKSLSLK